MGEDIQRLLGRLLLSVFFVSEATDKIRHFEQWVTFIAEAGMPAPEAEMALVVVLLVLGSLSIITGWKVRLGAGLLMIFLIPTALLFESGSGQIKSIALLGGLLLVMVGGAGRLALPLAKPPAAP